MDELRNLSRLLPQRGERKCKAAKMAAGQRSAMPGIRIAGKDHMIPLAGSRTGKKGDELVLFLFRQGIYFMKIQSGLGIIQRGIMMAEQIFPGLIRYQSAVNGHQGPLG